nr:ribonuclease H-like domain, reverse transcriptase, RNA-dependent DNA polymerase [Tanacetum cinerariifolium]
MPPKFDLSFARLDDSIYTFKISKTVTSVTKDEKMLLKLVLPIPELILAKIDFIKAGESLKHVKPVESVKYVKHVKTEEQTKNSKKFSSSPKVDRKDYNGKMTQKLGLGFRFIKKACFVCGSMSHLINDCTFHEDIMDMKFVLPLNYSQGLVEYQFVLPSQMLQHSAAKPVNIAEPKHSVKFSKSRSAFHKSHSPIKRSFYNATTHSRRNSTERVNTAGSKTVSAIKGNEGHPQQALKNKGIVDSTQDNVDARKEVSDQDYIMLPLWFSISSTFKSSDDKAVDDKPKDDTCSKTVAETINKEDQAYRDKLDRLLSQEKEASNAADALRKKSEQGCMDQRGTTKAGRTNPVNIVSNPVNAASTLGTFSTGGPSSPHPDAFIPTHTLLHIDQDDSQIPDLEDTGELQSFGIFKSAYDDDLDIFTSLVQSVGVEADFNYMESSTISSLIPTHRVHLDHPKDQILGDLNLAVQTRRMAKNSFGAHALVGYIHKQRRTNHKDYENYLFACFLSQMEPIKKSIRTKWVYKNKKDKRGIVVRNKARLVAQGHRQEERIDYDEVFTHVARIEAMGFIVYQMDVKSAILYGTIEEEVFQVTPKLLHLQAMKQIFRYLKGQPKLGLWYLRDSPFHLDAYSDSDYAGANLDRKSTIGGCQFLGMRLISWQCKKQTIVATSTTEVEDSYEKKLIQVLKIHAKDNVADLLTKAFDGNNGDKLVTVAGFSLYGWMKLCTASIKVDAAKLS